MDTLAKVLYEKFFMRDLLGKIVPGSILFYTISLYISPGRLTFAIPSQFNWLAGAVLFGLMLFLGLCLQMIGELLGIHSAHPRPLHILFLRTKRGTRARELFGQRLALIKKANLTDAEKDQRERYVALKEGSGNIAIALIVSTVALFNVWPLNLVLFILAILSFWAHVVHRSRQAYFEIGVLGLSEEQGYKGESLNTYIGRRL